MNVAYDLLTLAREHGIDLFVEGGSIRMRADSEPPSDLLDQLRNHKAEILAALQAANAPDPNTLPGPGMERRRQAVLQMLRDNPEITRAWTADGSADPVRIHLAVRGVGTCELTIASNKWDELQFLELLKKMEDAT